MHTKQAPMKTPAEFAAAFESVLFNLVAARFGHRISGQGHDNWKIWADQYRNDPAVDKDLLRAVDILTEWKVARDGEPFTVADRDAMHRQGEKLNAIES